MKRYLLNSWLLLTAIGCQTFETFPQNDQILPQVLKEATATLYDQTSNTKPKPETSPEDSAKLISSAQQRQSTYEVSYLKRSLQDSFPDASLEVYSETSEQIVMVIPIHYAFDPNSLDLLTSFRQALSHLYQKTYHSTFRLKTLRLHKALPLDQKGQKQYQALSRFFAQTAALKEIKVQDYSYHKPISSNFSQEGQRLNQRLELVFSSSHETVHEQDSK